MRWSLDSLYPSFDSEEYKRDLRKLDQLIKEIQVWADENLSSLDRAGEKIESYINYSQTLSSLFTRLMSFANLKITVDARDEEAIQYLDRLRIKSTEITKPEVQFQNFIKEIDNLDGLISSSELLREHSFYLRQIKDRSRYLLSEKEEILISKLSNTGSTAWSNLQDRLTSTLIVDIYIDGEDKQLPLSVVRNMAYDKDPNIRKLAYEAELKAYKKVEESSAAALNSIKGEVLTTSELRGFKSPLEETLFKSRMDKESLDAMLTAMEEFLPVFHKYYRKKAEILGHKNGLPFMTYLPL